MTTAEQAEEIAETWVARTTGRDDVIIDKTLTRTEEFGWVFFYNTKGFIEDRDILAGLAGNAPLVVFRDTGEVRVTGTAHPIDHYLDEIRAERGVE